MPARVNTIALDGIDARLIEVEVDFSPGLPALNVVGLPEAEVRESRERVRAALSNSGFSLPPRRITINLAPADIPKEGSGYDLPIAIGLLVAMGRLPQESLTERLFLGELALDGRIKPVPGALPAALFGKKMALKELVVAETNAPEAALVTGIQVVAAPHLSQLCGHLLGENPLAILPATDWQHWFHGTQQTSPNNTNFAEVKGQEHVKRALEIAASGGHNIIMNGPPGCGKSMLARCFPTILPELTFDEAIEVAAIYSVAGGFSKGTLPENRRPFRAPHHTASHVSLIGGGAVPKPGEVSLAHRGVLFLDELPEFERRTLEVLREPLEHGEVNISRAARSSRFPARFQLISACNPCPCGHLGDPFNECRCSPSQVDHYRHRLSGPLLDRIDLHVHVHPVAHDDLVALPQGEPSVTIRQRVVAARDRQYLRQENQLNAHLQSNLLEKHTQLDRNGKELMLAASRKLGISARGYYRILRVARTIADLAAMPNIASEHLAEAVQFRVGGRFPSI